tara:strand:- start:122 stop:1288 length:1167 start_codon:yes stop_codon:yes gene_type:complete
MTQVKSCLRFLLNISIFLALFACAPTPDPIALEQANLQGDQAIRNGYTDDQTNAVVGLVSVQGGGIGSCTGTLISPNVVLTARHCVAPTWNQVNGGVDCRQTSFGPTYSPDAIYVTNQVQLTRNPSDYKAVQEILAPNDTSFCGNDIALMILAEPVATKDIRPMVPRVDKESVTNEEYYAVGYGATNDGGGGSGLRRRRDDLTIDCVGSQCPSYYSRETEWIGDTGVCQGDSGGPAFDTLDRIIGIASRGSYGCDTPVYGSVFGWSEWIISETKAAARNAGIEAPNWSVGWPTDPEFSYPIGEICSSNNECTSGICTLNGYCTRRCNEDAPCPSGYSCDGQCIADIPEEPPEESIWSCRSVAPLPTTTLLLLGILYFLRHHRRNRFQG